MPKYAFINADGQCDGEANYSHALDPLPANAVLVDDGASHLGDLYDPETGQFTPQTPGVLPLVVITGITVSPDHAARAHIASDFSSMKLPVGATVTINAELQMAGQRLAGFAADFAMPMRSTDGVMRYLDMRFENGQANFSAVMSDSKRWEVTQELVNSSLPPESHMGFAGIVITAVEGAPA